MNKTVLIVDDNELNRDLLSFILEDDYTIECAEDGEQAIEKINRLGKDICVVLLDLVMPKVDGIGVLEYMKQNEIAYNIPVLIISGENDVEIERKCFALGANDFIRKPFDNYVVKRRVKNISELYIYKNQLEGKVDEQTDSLKKQNELLKQQAVILRKNNENIIEILGTVVESRDLESGEHVQRVKGYTEILANQMMEDYPEYELTSKKIELIVAAAALHDIGKIAIPDNILLKPGRLTPEEFDVMKSHTTRGCDILDKIEDAWTEEYGRYSYEICRHHHEKYDGKGYPDGLKEDEIPISAQCVSIADVYDALVNERCYKDAFTPAEAFDMITGGKCGQFSPKLLKAFTKRRKDFEALAPAVKPE